MLAAGRHASIGMTQVEVFGELMGVPTIKVSELMSAETTKTNLEEENTTQDDEQMDTGIPTGHYSDSSSSQYRYTPSPSSSVDESYNY
jgi:hypothetical protein